VVYSGVRPQDVAEIVRQHLVRGQVVERLLYKKKDAPEPADDTLDLPPLDGTLP
jgi:(2Fe-2S) ferredoxin